MQKKLHIRKGDTVMVIAGASKGTKDKPVIGKVISVDREKQRAKVEGVNMIKKHTKPSAKHPQGGIIDQEAGIHISNLMLVVNGKPTRTGRKVEDGKSVRYSKKSGEVIK